MGLGIVEVVIWLEYASFLPFIHFQLLFSFVMFPSISEIQPRRVSWGDNIKWHCCQGEENRSSASLGDDTASSFDDRQGLNTDFGCNHMFGDSTGGRPSFGDSTLKFWRSC